MTSFPESGTREVRSTNMVLLGGWMFGFKASKGLRAADLEPDSGFVPEFCNSPVLWHCIGYLIYLHLTFPIHIVETVILFILRSLLK
jgi:hypothetical protein